MLVGNFKRALLFDREIPLLGTYPKTYSYMQGKMYRELIPCGTDSTKEQNTASITVNRLAEYKHSGSSSRKNADHLNLRRKAFMNNHVP